MDKLPRMKCAALRVCASLLTAGASSLYAGTVPAAAPQEGPVISLHVENDMFVGDDDNYTSGVRIGWMSGTTAESRTFSGMLGTVLGGTNASDSWRRFMGMNGSSNLRQQWGLDLTQLMFTPERKLREPIYGEHPYVGNLTLGLISLVKMRTGQMSWNSSWVPRVLLPWPRAPSIWFIRCGGWNNGPAGTTSFPAK